MNQASRRAGSSQAALDHGEPSYCISAKCSACGEQEHVIWTLLVPTDAGSPCRGDLHAGQFPGVDLVSTES